MIQSTRASISNRYFLMAEFQQSNDARTRCIWSGTFGLLVVSDLPKKRFSQVQLLYHIQMLSADFVAVSCRSPNIATISSLILQLRKSVIFLRFLRLSPKERTPNAQPASAKSSLKTCFRYLSAAETFIALVTK